MRQSRVVWCPTKWVDAVDTQSAIPNITIDIRAERRWRMDKHQSEHNAEENNELRNELIQLIYSGYDAKGSVKIDEVGSEIEKKVNPNRA